MKTAIEDCMPIMINMTVGSDILCEIAGRGGVQMADGRRPYLCQKRSSAPSALNDRFNCDKDSSVETELQTLSRIARRKLSPTDLWKPLEGGTKQRRRTVLPPIGGDGNVCLTPTLIQGCKKAFVLPLVRTSSEIDPSQLSAHTREKKSQKFIPDWLAKPVHTENTDDGVSMETQQSPAPTGNKRSSASFRKWRTAPVLVYAGPKNSAITPPKRERSKSLFNRRLSKEQRDRTDCDHGEMDEDNDSASTGDEGSVCSMSIYKETTYDLDLFPAVVEMANDKIRDLGMQMLHLWPKLSETKPT